jgi:hypothetical protein
VDRAQACVKQAIATGWKDKRLLETDPDLAKLPKRSP